MIVITDILKEPLDEGAKVATSNLVKCLKKEHGSIIFSVNGDEEVDIVDYNYYLNKLFFNFEFYNKIRECLDKIILYIPEASATPTSIIRAKLLKLFTGKDVTLLSLQPRSYKSIVKTFIRVIQPNHIITQSIITKRYLESLDIRCKKLSLGVDDSKYTEASEETRKILRKKYSINIDKKVVLHVGHIKKSRNLEWLLRIKLELPEAEIIIVGSTYSADDEKVYKKLVKNGIIVFREYLENIEEIYNIADYYVFPVVQNDGAIETPLSVFEAMACNLPVITTRFGSLPDLFSEDQYFHFVSSSDEIIEILKSGKAHACNNRQKIQPFTWNQTANQLINILNSDNDNYIYIRH